MTNEKEIKEKVYYHGKWYNLPLNKEDREEIIGILNKESENKSEHIIFGGIKLIPDNEIANEIMGELCNI